MGFNSAPPADTISAEASTQALEEQRRTDLMLLGMFNNNGGITTAFERTDFGKHIDHTNAFYDSLGEEQQEAFVSPLDKGQDLADFEATLNPEQLERWQDLKEDSNTLGIWYNPENETDLGLAVSSLRTMMDNYPSSDPQEKLVQDQLIEKLGGEDAVHDLIQDSMDPEIGAEGLPSDIKETLLNAGNDTYTFEVANNGVDQQEVVGAFFNGQPIEVVGTSDGGLELTDSATNPAIENPALQNDAEVEVSIPKGP